MGMKKQNMAGMMAMMIAMSDMQQDFNTGETKPKVKKPIKKIIPKGLKEFFYGEKVIYALNKKNADRKALKQGLIIHDVVVTSCQCEELANINDSLIGEETCVKCDKPIDRQY